MVETAKELAFILFDQGKRPSDPEVKALGVKRRSTYTYFQDWKKSHPELNGTTIDKPDGSATGKGGTTTPKPSGSDIRTTEGLANAQQLRFVPRIYTTDYSPIIRAAQDAAVEFWGWPSDMTLGDFLDTALHFLFKEHGITLAGYTISDEARKALDAELKEREARGEHTRMQSTGEAEED